jgi:hypothetical protein
MSGDRASQSRDRDTHLGSGAISSKKKHRARRMKPVVEVVR